MEFILELVRKRALGSVQGQAANPETLQRILAEADYLIIVVNDAEQGFPATKLPMIPLNALAACDNPEYCRAFAKGIVNDAKNAGFNATWGPVVDVLYSDGPFKVSRTFRMIRNVLQSLRRLYARFLPIIISSPAESIIPAVTVTVLIPICAKAFVTLQKKNLQSVACIRICI